MYGMMEVMNSNAALHNGNDWLGLCIPDVRVYDAACMETLLVFGNDEKPVDGYCEIFHNLHHHPLSVWSHRPVLPVHRFGRSVVAWFRLSVIGSVSYELVAADMAAIGAGYDSLAALVAANDVSVVGSVMLSMSIGIIGGVVGCLFIGKKIHLSTMEYSASNVVGRADDGLLHHGYALCIPACPKHLHGFGRHCYPGADLGFL